MEVLVPVAIAFAAFVGLGMVAFVSWAGWNFYKIIRSLRDEIRINNRSMNGVPVLLDGIKEICGDLAANTLALGGSVNVLKKSLIDETSDPRRPGVIQYDDSDADREYMRRIVEQNEALAAEESNRFIVGE